MPFEVKILARLLMKKARKDRNREQGYTVYYYDNEYYIQEDNGLPMLTVSNFSNLKPEKLKFIIKPNKIFLLHTHPFSDYPLPSTFDIDTIFRFCDYYKCPVVSIIIGRKGYFISDINDLAEKIYYEFILLRYISEIELLKRRGKPCAKMGED